MVDKGGTESSEVAGPRRKRLAVAAAVLMLGLICGLVGVAEWYVRHREVTRTTVPGTLPHIYYPHIRQRFALVRDFDYFGWVHINRLGLRGTEVAPEKADGVYRILAIGESTTFDPYVTADSLAWPARLEHELSALDGSRTYQVLNAGTPGYRVLDNLIRLQSELLALAPDLILVYEGHNDLYAALGSMPEQWSPRPDQVPTITPWGRWLQEHSLLVAKVRGRLRVVGGGGAAPGERASFDARLEAGLDQLRSDLTSLQPIAAAHNVRVVLPTVVRAWDPQDPDVVGQWARAIPFATSEQVGMAYDAYNRAIEDVGRARSLEVIDTRGFGLDSKRYYAEGDPIHFNDAGAERMARELAFAIYERVVRPAAVGEPGGG